MENTLIRTEEFFVNRINKIDEAIDKCIEILSKKEGITSYNLISEKTKTHTEYDSYHSINENIMNLECHRKHFMKQLKKLQNPKKDKTEK